MLCSLSPVRPPNKSLQLNSLFSTVSPSPSHPIGPFHPFSLSRKYLHTLSRNSPYSLFFDRRAIPMASVFLNHVVGDLTVGKPELAEFSEAETLEAAVRAIADSPEGAISVWRMPPPVAEPAAPSSERFVGMLNSLDVAAFLARAGGDYEQAMRTPVSDVVVPNPSLVKEVDPGTRLVDALELMKLGTRRFLVRKYPAWKGITKRFSILDNGRWLQNLEIMPSSAANNSSLSSSSTLRQNKFCCLSREDVVRFLIGCLGALAPIPLSTISSLGAFNPHYSFAEASSSALEATSKISNDACAIAVVEINSDGLHKILGDISAYKLWKCDYIAAAWALANLSAGQFAIGIDDNTSALASTPDYPTNSPVEDPSSGTSPRSRKASSRSTGFLNSQWSLNGRLRSMYRGRSKPLTCKHTSSLAAVMAQMLSYRATHIWVIDAEMEDDILVGVVSYTDILDAVAKYPSFLLPPVF